MLDILQILSTLDTDTTDTKYTLETLDGQLRAVLKILQMLKISQCIVQIVSYMLKIQLTLPAVLCQFSRSFHMQNIFIENFHLKEDWKVSLDLSATVQLSSDLIAIAVHAQWEGGEVK